MQRARRLPSPEPHATHLNIGVVGSQQRHRVAVGGDDVALAVGADEPHLDALDGRVDVARHPARGRLLPQHIPRFDRPAKLDLHTVEHGRSDAGEPELGERIEPAGVEVDAVRPQICGDIRDIVNQEVWQQISSVQIGAVADEWRPQRFIPEPCDQRPHQQRLHHRHLVMRRHLESAQFQQTQPAAWTVGAVQLVDAELGPVGVAGDVGQQVPQRPVDDPRPGACRCSADSRAISAKAISSSYSASARPSSTRGACDVVPMNRPENR